MTFNLGEVYVVAVAHRCTFSVPVNVNMFIPGLLKAVVTLPTSSKL